MKKTKRPISRNFWSFLRFIPKFVRGPFLRSKFEISNDLPSDLVLKQAETEAEISAALKLVYDSYLELNYIDPNRAGLRLTKYHLLPTTVILVIKRKEEVIGTLSIIMDSAMKLPSDVSWDLTSLRQNGRQIAEISCLCIKKNELRRGKLLLPLCKLMYLYCKNLLQLDGIVVSTTVEVENFYTDILLFEKIALCSGQGNKLVKDNPSTCCFLSLKGSDAEENYKKTYNKKNEKFNLYNFFVEKDLSNIKLPAVQRCLQSYTIQQTAARSKILQQYPDLAKSLTIQDQQTITNLDLSQKFSFGKSLLGSQETIRDHRYEVRQKAKCFLPNGNKLIEITLLNVSKSGFKLVLNENESLISSQTAIVLIFSIDQQRFYFEGEIVWIHSNMTLGCQVKNKDTRWLNYFETIAGEYKELAA